MIKYKFSIIILLFALLFYSKSLYADTIEINSNSYLDDGGDIELIPSALRNKMNLSYTLSFDSQYSLNTLNEAEEYGVSEQYMTKSFRERIVNDDDNYYVRSDLSLNIKQLFPESILKSNVIAYGKIFNSPRFDLSINDFLNNLYFSIFYNYGYVKDKNYSNNVDYNFSSGYVAGSGLALKYHGEYINWSLTYAKTLRSPEFLKAKKGIERGNYNLTWEIAGKF